MMSFNNVSIKMALREAGFRNIFCRPTKNRMVSVMSPILAIIRYLCEFGIRIYLRTYTREAFSLIFTPNFITVAIR
jgi:hypothetical protein